MPKQLLVLFAITAILFACKQTETDERKYTSREWDSITKAKQTNTFDSIVTAYKKLAPEDSFYLREARKKQLNLVSKNILNTGTGNLTIEHWDYSRVCSKKQFLYVYKNNNRTIVRLPDFHGIAYKPELLTRFETDFNNLISSFNIDAIADNLIRQYLDVTSMDRLDIPSLTSYENIILNGSACSKECRQDVSEQMKIVKSNLQDNSYKVYRYGFYFLSVKIDEKANPKTYHFELLNPRCYCSICF